MPERVYGIRHHGPGSARAVTRALDRQRPDVVLVEGPPEADDLIRWAADGGLAPPVALLGYATGDPRRAAFWPFAVFSPEWQAIRWAVEHDVPVRFFDLPFAYRAAGAVETVPRAAEPAETVPRGAEPAETVPRAAGPGEAAPVAAAASRPGDPIAELAAAAGYDDAERWWEDLVEHRGAPAFEAIAEAMAALREGAREDPHDLVREAYMRTALRAARRAHHDVAVVCGAWHVPALTRTVPASHDAALLKGRRKAKVAFTWVPWTYGRLATAQGYAAGVRSPGWYHHLFTARGDVVPSWLVAAARVLRDEGAATSSAHVIEATRLAEALATLRGRPLAGLAELTEATEAVLCEGDRLRRELVDRRLVVGERLGSVPAGLPAAPLARDLAAEQRRLRLKPAASPRELDLDLRGDTDLGRSRLLHRLRCLDVPWGEPDDTRRGIGTFREQWQLCWQPEFAIRLVEASAHGATVAEAAAALVAARAAAAATLADVTALVEVCLLADLDGAYRPVLRALDARAALDADVAHLMAAIPALARTLRYGDVRRTDLAGLGDVTRRLLARVCAGLPAVVGGLSDEAAAGLRKHVDAVHAAVSLLDDAEQRTTWLDALASVVDRDDLPGLLAGRLTRLLFDAGRLDATEVRRRMGLPLTIGVPPAHGASWVEGFLAGGGLLLVHDPALLSLVDSWIADVPTDAFVDVLPLLRRTFGAFAPAERRAVGEKVAGAGPVADGAPGALDHDRARSVLPTLSLLLGQEIR